jgi:hypothetical protein
MNSSAAPLAPSVKLGPSVFGNSQRRHSAGERSDVRLAVSEGAVV